MEPDKKEEVEVEIDLDYFFKFDDIEALPKTYFSNLATYCEQTLEKLEEFEKMSNERGIEDLQPELELTYFRAMNHAGLMVAPLFKNEGLVPRRVPDFSKYEPMTADDDFVFI